MADKMICPGCDSYTSDVARHFQEQSPCPYCGLSATATAEILAARERNANEDLIQKFTEASLRADKAEAHLGQLRGKLLRLRSELGSNDDYAADDGW